MAAVTALPDRWVHQDLPVKMVSRVRRASLVRKDRKAQPVPLVATVR